MRPILLAIYGHKNSGKTVLIEYLTHKLTQLGYKVATIKHIYCENFEIDYKGKDTWRHKSAGAISVAGISNGRLAIIDDSINNIKAGLEIAIEYIEKHVAPHIILLEGFHNVTAHDPRIYKIILLKENENLIIWNPENIINAVGTYTIKNKEKETVLQTILENVLHLLNAR